MSLISLINLVTLKIYDYSEGRRNNPLDGESFVSELKKIIPIMDTLEQMSWNRSQESIDKIDTALFNSNEGRSEYTRMYNKFVQQHQRYVSITTFLTLVARAYFKDNPNYRIEYLKRTVNCWFENDRDSIFFVFHALKLFQAIEDYLDSGKEVTFDKLSPGYLIYL